MDRKTEFVTKVRRHFDGLTSLLDGELTLATKGPWDDSAKFFLVEYDSPQFADDFSTSLWIMGATGEPVDSEHWFLKGKAVVVPSDIYEAEAYQDIEPWDTASELFEEWFVERWQAHASHILPAYIGHHDSYFKRSLLTGKAVNWDRIIEGANG